jgi:hypothetical protein
MATGRRVPSMYSNGIKLISKIVNRLFKILAHVNKPRIRYQFSNLSEAVGESFQLKGHNVRHLLGEIGRFSCIILFLTFFTVIFIPSSQLVRLKKVGKSLKKRIRCLAFLQSTRHVQYSNHNNVQK